MLPDVGMVNTYSECLWNITLENVDLGYLSMLVHVFFRNTWHYPPLHLYLFLWKMFLLPLYTEMTPCLFIFVPCCSWHQCWLWYIIIESWFKVTPELLHWQFAVHIPLAFGIFTDPLMLILQSYICRIHHVTVIYILHVWQFHCHSELCFTLVLSCCLYREKSILWHWVVLCFKMD